MKTHIICIFLIVAINIFLTGCNSSAPSEKVVQLKASRAAVDLWKSWGGKYVLYAHRNANIHSFKDLNGKEDRKSVV